MFDQNLVHAVIGGKDLDSGTAELSVNPGLTIGGLARGHGSLLNHRKRWFARARIQEKGLKTVCQGRPLLPSAFSRQLLVLPPL